VVTFFSVVAWVLAPGVSGTSAVRGQQTTPPPAAATPSAQEKQPAAPVMQFPPAGISLDEAIRITLEHDPVLQRRRVDVQFSQGFAQELRGVFDYTFRANAEWTRRVQELSEAAKEAEREKRQELQDFIDENIGLRDEVRRLGPLLNQIATAAPGSVPIEEVARINPTIASTLSVLDQLIVTEPNPVARQGLLDLRTDFLSDVVDELGVDITSLESEFAETERQLTNLGEAPIDEFFVDARGRVQLDKLFRSGIFMSPFLEADFMSTNYLGKARDAELGGKAFPDQLRFLAGVDFSLPLRRNRGVVGTAAAERAAAIDLDAARLALNHEASSRALATTEAYWNLRAAQDVVDIAARSLKFQDEALAATRQLIAAQQVAAIEEARGLASRSRVQSQLEDAERRLVEARVQLALVMGVAVNNDPGTLPRAADPFPPPAGEQAPIPGLIDQAIERRQDLSAAAKTVQAGDVLLAGARRNLAARLDFNGGTWFTAIGEGKGSESYDRWVGPSGRLGFDYEKPLGNNVQQGRLAQTEADATRRRIDQVDLERQIRLNVIEAAGSLQQAAGRLEQAQASVGHYDRTIESMMRLLASGNARLIDALTTQEQQIDAMLQVVAAQHELALRQARLRYETGSLIPAGPVKTDAAPASRERR
jgi:outer membrane protein TolC